MSDRKDSDDEAGSAPSDIVTDQGDEAEPEADAAQAEDASAADDAAEAKDADAEEGEHAEAEAEPAAKPEGKPVKQKSAFSSVLGLLGFIAALAGGFFVGQWIKKDDSAAGTLEDERRFKVKLRGDEPQKGPDDALVTIIEFADYQCPYCEKALDPLEEALAEFPGEVRLIYKHFPLQMHPAAGPAARAAWAAHKQGKFWEVHRFLFENKARLDGLDAKARELGLDYAQLQRDMISKEAGEAVDDDFKAGGRIGVTGTPQFIVNGHRYKGALDASRWKDVIENELEAAKDLDVPRGEVYGKLMDGAIEKAAPDAAGQPRRPGEPDPAVSYQVPVGADRPSLGPADALVTVVVFSDFQCPYCARLAPVMHELASTYGVRVVFLQMPLAMHPQAEDAARASLAAHRQGKFWEMHDAMFAKQGELRSAPGNGFATFVQELGLDADQFASDMADPAIKEMVQQDSVLARQLGVSGTPASFVNGRFVRGAADATTFGVVIEEQKVAAQALVDAGTPAAQVYDALMQKAAAPIKAGPERG